MFRQIGENFSNLHTRLPAFLNGLLQGSQKVNIKREGKCEFLLEWKKGVRCSDFRAFADPVKRAVTLQYQHSEASKNGTASSASNEYIEQSLALDPDCVVNDSVVKLQLAGFMQNDPSDCTKDGHKVRIVFPSRERALELEKSGQLPEGTVKSLESGDTEVVSKLTDEQACLLIQGGHDCENLKRAVKLSRLADGDENAEEEGALESDEGAASYDNAEMKDPVAQKDNRIPLPKIGHINNEL